MRVIFMGTPDFAVPTLDAVVQAGHEVLAVVAQPDRPSGRGHKLQAPPTVLRARELGIPTRQPKAVKQGPFPEWMESAGADVAVVVAYGRILTPRLLAAPRLGCLNVHASLLPRYRGAAPIQWAVIRGERETGISIMQMDEGLDTGDVLLTRSTPIGPDETAGELWARLSALGAECLVEVLADLPTRTPTPQDHSAATHAPPLSKDDGRVDWTQPAQAVHDRIRGVTPAPGAWSELSAGGAPSERIKILRARPVEGSGPPGQIIDASGRLAVAAGEGAVELLELLRPGKKPQPGGQFVLGVRLKPGDSFA